MIDLLITHASQLLTCPPGARGARRGAELGDDVGLLVDGAVAIDHGRVLAIGSTADILAQYPTARTHLHAHNQTICPGFIDSHTHLIYAGERLDEFAQKLAGASYLQILASGGGILHTMRQTRKASLAELVALARPRLSALFALGTTTAEVKTGYGLDTATELNMLEAIAQLDQSQPVTLIPTFLAHTVPPEYHGRADDYVNYIIHEMIPAMAEWHSQSHFAAKGQPFFMDVFCEQEAFSVAQTERLLQAGLAQGWHIKLHADQFNELGGVPLAVRLGAVSVDHLEATTAVSASIPTLATSETIATLLPAVNFHLGHSQQAPARVMIDAGTAVCLATDHNPGSSPCYSLPFVMGLACRLQKLTPAEALNACTVNAAHALRLGGKIGSLLPGYTADLLILDVPDYRYLSYELGRNPVTAVVKQGVSYKL
jgi:imidazolonepropionase